MTEGRRRWGAAVVAVGSCLIAACGGNQTIFNPQGPQARSIATLGWWLIGMCGVVYVLTMLALFWALSRRRRVSDDLPETTRSLTRTIAVAVAAKLAPALIAREPMAEIAALATESFHHLVATPHVAVRVGPTIFEIAKTKFDEIAQGRGFEGRLAVISDERLAAGDCRIEWTDGGVIRDQAATSSAIDEMVNRYISARTANGA